MAPYTGFSKGRCISPEASQLLDALEAEALQEADPNVPIAPVQLPPPPPFSAVVGFDMAALLVQNYNSLHENQLPYLLYIQNIIYC
jgi:hypothetical protein